MELNTLKQLIDFDKYGGAIKDMMLYFNIYDLTKITEDMAQEYLAHRREKEDDGENNTSNSGVQQD